MNSMDTFSMTLLEEGKRFLEKATDSKDDEAAVSYFHAALLLGFSALEAHMNAIADELLLRQGLDILDRSILQEKDFALEDGTFDLTNRLKMYRLEDRLSFLFARFSTAGAPSGSAWWADLKFGMDLRNRLVHPKTDLKLTESDVAKALLAIVECLNALFIAVFGKAHPSYNRRLSSSMHF
jgi:hypothetical protein